MVLMCKRSKVIWWWYLHFGGTQAFYYILHTIIHAIKLICVRLSSVRKETQHQIN